MNSTALETAEKELIREEILATCRMAGQGGADTKVIKTMLKKAGYDLGEEEVRMQADYLKQKGLVSIRDVSNRKLGISRVIVCITALGTDWLEGNAPDIPGIGG